jgi:hypothetical protein
MVVAMATSLTISSCLTEDDTFIQDQFSTEEHTIILGEKLQNPFSVSNMRLAYERLIIDSSRTQALQKLNIRKTHLYIRFLPGDEAALDKLTNDTTLIVFDHPLDYEILREGDFYHDPSIPLDKPTFQYATVPVNYTAPEGIAFEILEELYLPQRDLSLLSTSGRIDSQYEEFAEVLEDEALALTGNAGEIPEHDTSDASARKKSKWYPSGKITLWDSRLNRYIPLEGVKVQARRWFDVKEGFTDAAGNYRMDGAFRHKASYCVKWERDKFDIRSGTFGQAKVNGPKIRGQWNLQIERGGMAYHYAHVFRAALRYYYGDIGGLQRPSFRIKYSVFNKKGNHMARNIGNWSVFGINPNILIYRYNPTDGSENDSDEIFSMTCHETAHATHMQVMKAGAVQFLQVSETIRESWAIGVEWFITQKEYKEKGISNYAEANYKVRANYPTLYGFQFWNKNRNESLTSLFIDLVDRNNQQGQSFESFSRGTVSDPVYGYTLAGIESGFLKEVYGLGSLSEKLKAHKPAETTDQQIDVLLTNF